MAVAWGEGDALMQLTTGELQAFTVHHMALIWRVRPLLTPVLGANAGVCIGAICSVCGVAELHSEASNQVHVAGTQQCISVCLTRQSLRIEKTCWPTPFSEAVPVVAS